MFTGSQKEFSCYSVSDSGETQWVVVAGPQPGDLLLTAPLADAVKMRISAVNYVVSRDCGGCRDSLPQIVLCQQLEPRPGLDHKRLAVIVAHVNTPVADNRR